MKIVRTGTERSGKRTTLISFAVSALNVTRIKPTPVDTSKLSFAARRELSMQQLYRVVATAPKDWDTGTTHTFEIQLSVDDVAEIVKAMGRTELER